MKSASSTDCREKRCGIATSPSPYPYLHWLYFQWDVFKTGVYRKEHSPLSSFPLDVLRIFVNNEKNDGAIRYIVVGLFIFYNGTSS